MFPNIVIIVQRVDRAVTCQVHYLELSPQVKSHLSSEWSLFAIFDILAFLKAPAVVLHLLIKIIGKSDRLLLNPHFTETLAEVVHSEHISEVDKPAHIWLTVKFDSIESLGEISSFDVWVHVLNLDS